jgi:hypothetical protein
MRTATLIFLLLGTRAFAQEWVEYHHDSTLIISMPYYHYEREEKGLLLSSAKIEGGVVVISHVPIDKLNIRDSSDLRQAYNIFRDGLVKTQQGKLLRSKIIDRDGLKWLEFVDRGSVEGVRQLIYNRVLFINDAMYCLVFFEMGPSSPEKDKARKKIFSSVSIASGISKEQISTKLTFQPLLVNDPITRKVIFGVGLIVLIAIILLFISKVKGERGL